MNDPITVEAQIHAPIEKVWQSYTSPEEVVKWNAASPDWHCPHAENDLRPGGSFSYRMEARDGSASFDFEGVYGDVVVHERITYTMEDGRKVETLFIPGDDGVHVIVHFDPETENTRELQQTGWQSILNNFKKHVESS
jgi:uncharacterized protein YndB with AHSA1/START domain